MSQKTSVERVRPYGRDNDNQQHKNTNCSCTCLTDLLAEMIVDCEL